MALLEPGGTSPQRLVAFRTVHREIDSAIRLVLAGHKTWARGEVDKLLDRLRLRGAVLEIGHVDNRDLPALYGGAEAFVFPSLWEGFGLPVVEAMASGTPVLTSKLSSLPEVAGGAALLVDPYSVEDIAEGLGRLLTDAALRTRLRTLGLVRARDFSWHRTAAETLEVYRQLGAS